MLIVDDIAFNRAVLVDMLQPLGFETLEAKNGQQALELAQTYQPDLILMDRRMPVMDGLDAIRHLRRMPALQQIPIISISASVSDEDKAKIMAAGYNAFLPKPVHRADLMTLLEENLPVEWRYEDKDDVAETTDKTIILPPKADLVSLVECAQRGSMSQIEAWAEALAARGTQYQPLADQMLQLARAFEVKKITQLTRRYLDQAEE